MSFKPKFFSKTSINILIFPPFSHFAPYSLFTAAIAVLQMSNFLFFILKNKAFACKPNSVLNSGFLLKI